MIKSLDFKRPFSIEKELFAIIVNLFFGRLLINGKNISISLGQEIIIASLFILSIDNDFIITDKVINN